MMDQGLVTLVAVVLVVAFRLLACLKHLAPNQENMRAKAATIVCVHMQT